MQTTTPSLQNDLPQLLEKVQLVTRITSPFSKARSMALKKIQYRLRTNTRHPQYIVAMGNPTDVKEDATVYSAVDNEDVKCKFFGRLYGCEILVELI